MNPTLQTPHSPTRRRSLYLLAALLLSAAPLADAALNLFGSSAEKPPEKNPHEGWTVGIAPERRHDYRLTFKKPFYYNNTVPFWETFGSTIMAPDSIRLAPSIPGMRGSIWSTIPNPHPEWEVIFSIKITGTQVGGGRGIAFWYIKDRARVGPVFGNADAWDGVGVLLDSTGTQERRDLPAITTILNDGTDRVISKDPKDVGLGTCYRDFRNTEHPLQFKVTYHDNILEVWMEAPSNRDSFVPCFKRPGIKLPTGYYFGMSAFAQYPADDHDVYSFETYQLKPPAKTIQPMRPLEKEKLTKGEGWMALNEEEKKRIEEIRSQVDQIQLADALNGTLDAERIRSIAAVVSNQNRMTEMVDVIVRQLQSLGAPSPQQIAEGKFEESQGKSDEKLAAAQQSLAEEIGRKLSRRIDAISTTIDTLKEEMTKQSKLQLDSLLRLEQIMNRVEAAMKSMDSRLSTQVSVTQNKISEAARSTTEAAQGSTYKYLMYTFWLLVGQVIIVGSCYTFYKRADRNEKKFI